MGDSLFGPIFNYKTLELEDKDIYLNRVRKLLPNFPEEVLIQWFYDHSQQVAEHEWLNYRRLTFSLINWKTDDVPVQDFGNTQAVATYQHNFFIRNVQSNRRERLESHFQKHGTWPIAPVFLRNEKGNLKYPYGVPCGKPFHLLEGHNRMAIFLEYKKHKRLSEHHLVYIAEILGEIS